MPGTLFSDVIDWFLSRVGDRRRYKRRAGAFHVWYDAAKNPAVQAVGTEISPAGLVFISNKPIEEQAFQLAIGLRAQRFSVRARIVHARQVEHKGETWTRYACEFTGIAADNWDLIVRYVNDVPETDRRKLQNQEMTERVDDAYRLLPMAIQEKIVRMLVMKRRLEEPKPGQTPLLKLFYGGIERVAGKSPMHRFNVHSRIMVNDQPVAYDTRFLVADDGTVVMQ